MKTKVQTLLLALMTLSAVQHTAAQGTAFTYQGQLQSGGSLANGRYDFQFSLTNALSRSSQVGSTLTELAVGVTNGLFTTTLDFGAVFAANPTWLAISVRTNGVGGYVGLNPLQPLTPTPYAAYAESAGSVGLFTGPIENNQLSGGGSITVTPGPGLSGGGPVVLGGVVTLNNTGVLSVSGPSDITASTSGGVVTMGCDATDSSVANTIVKRDATGSFSANNSTLGGGLYLPELAIIYAGGTPVMYADDADNYFAGIGTGNLATTGFRNIIVGTGSPFEENTSGSENTACGWYALCNNVTGFGNTADGGEALFDNTTGTYNTADGVAALSSNATGSHNTADGVSALTSNTTGSDNTAFGYNALSSLISGGANIGVGLNAGDSFTGNETGNIDIGNDGVQGENNTIRIGSDQTTTVIAGIYNGTLGSAGIPVEVDAAGHLGVRVSSAKFKHDIQPMGDVSDVLLKLKPVTFKYNADRDPSGTPEFGLVAEQVNEVDPDLVVRDGHHQIYSVRYEAVNAMLLNEFLKQHQTVEAQNTEIVDLKARLEKVEQIISNLKAN